jgi:hypothetical protein
LQIQLHQTFSFVIYLLFVFLVELLENIAYFLPSGMV